MKYYKKIPKLKQKFNENNENYIQFNRNSNSNSNNSNNRNDEIINKFTIYFYKLLIKIDIVCKI